MPVGVAAREPYATPATLPSEVLARLGPAAVIWRPFEIDSAESMAPVLMFVLGVATRFKIISLVQGPRPPAHSDE